MKIIALLITTGLLASCANSSLNTNNMTKGQQTAVGCGAGAVVGSIIGAIAGGGKGAAIGAGAGGALGCIAGYALATDPYTQSVNQQANDWQQQTGAQPQVVKVSEVQEQGQTRQQIDVQNIYLTDSQMVDGKHLKKAVKTQLQSAKQKSMKVNGNVEVKYPPETTETILADIRSTGVDYSEDPSLSKNYVITLSRKSTQSAGYQL